MTGAGGPDDGTLAGLKAIVLGWTSGPGARRRLLLVFGMVLLLIVAFRLGEWRAGYSVDAQGNRLRLEDRIKALEQENREAAEQVARLQTDARIDRETYAQVEGQLTDLQGKIIEQQEELAFYRGVVGGPGKGGLRVQDFSLKKLPSSGLRLHFVVARVEGAGKHVRGEVQVRVEGMRGGRLVSLDLASLVENRDAAALSFNLRYFQDMEVALRIPSGFTPQRVVIRIVPTTGGLKPSVESFPWAPQRA